MILKVTNLTIMYDQIEAVKGVSLELEQGKIILKESYKQFSEREKTKTSFVKKNYT